MFSNSNRYLWVPVPSISFRFAHALTSVVLFHLVLSFNYVNHAQALEWLFLGE